MRNPPTPMRRSELEELGMQTRRVFVFRKTGERAFHIRMWFGHDFGSAPTPAAPIRLPMRDAAGDPMQYTYDRSLAGEIDFIQECATLIEAADFLSHCRWQERNASWS